MMLMWSQTQNTVLAHCFVTSDIVVDRVSYIDVIAYRLAARLQTQSSYNNGWVRREYLSRYISAIGLLYRCRIRYRLTAAISDGLTEQCGAICSSTAVKNRQKKLQLLIPAFENLLFAIQMV